MRKFIIFTVAIFSTVVASGCGDDESPTGGGDMTPPTVTNVVPVDVNHLQLDFDEALRKGSAEQAQNYVIVELATPASPDAFLLTTSPGDTIGVATAVLAGDQRTVILSTFDAMSNVPYEISVTGVQDLSGNKITTPVLQTFTGTDASDTTPPEIVFRSPAPGATGVDITESVVVQFSEPMQGGSVQAAFQWSWATGMVSWDMQEEGENRFVFSPLQALENNRLYTVTVTGLAQDLAGNALASSPVTWNFTTTAVVDNTPPTLVSSVPANNAVNVPVGTNISLTFSEPIDPTSLENVMLTPDPGSGVETWSNGGSTVTFDPDLPLQDDTQYSLLLPPGGVRDLAGNGFVGAVLIAWTTGASLESGSFSGTISGDPNSSSASNPYGALVAAATSNPFGPNDDFDIAGTAAVGMDGTYDVIHLPDGWYWPISVMDSNGDGQIDPGTGDAFGAYGIEIGVDNTPDSVLIAGGNTVTGVDFGLFDAIAISGTITYGGTAQAPYSVGVFDTTGFDIASLPPPDFSNSGFWPFEPSYEVDQLDNGLVDGTYYVGAYLDVNFTGSLELGVDPVGFYSSSGQLIPITLANGQDALDVDIELIDPGTMQMTGVPVSWRGAGPAHDGVTSLRRMRDKIRRALLTTTHER